MASTTFRVVIELGGKTATGFEVPAQAVADLGTTKRPPVRVTIGDHTYRSTVADETRQRRIDKTVASLREGKV